MFVVRALTGQGIILKLAIAIMIAVSIDVELAFLLGQLGLSTLNVIIIAGGGMATTLGVLYVMYRIIVVPIQTLIGIALRIAQGDLRETTDYASKDEIGQLATALRETIIYQRAMASAADSLAQGDLTIGVAPKSDQDRLGNAFAQMIVSLRTLIGQVQSSAHQVATASQQISAAAEQSAGGTQQVATTIQQVAQGTAAQTESMTKTMGTVDQVTRAIDGVAHGAQEQATAVARSAEITAQISSAIQQVASNAQAGTDSSIHAARTARAGVEIVRETVVGMETIRAKVNLAVQKVQDLGQRSEEIGDIVQTINYIASQTNLFALNAAIEAARAGEHGKGFAVVADEVRKLSENAAGATKEIATLIKQVQKTVAEAAQAMNDGATEVEAGVKRSTQSGEALQAILEAVESTNRQVGEIAAAAQQVNASANEMVGAMDTVSAIVEENTAATEEMSAGASDFAMMIENITSISEENSASTEEVSATVEEVSAQSEEVTASAQALNEMAQNLQALVVQFKL
ncbi:MAG: methyl-accepting chemotaxis protein, partial [Anaerolineae bacterium]|nr:methyl-accepting chemotaxis protein [Anaerolineae bacterium]